MNIQLMDIPELKQRLLVHEAKRWLGFVEVGGDNKGPAVEMFQKHVDDRAVGEPWCMAFVQFCIGQVDELVDEFLYCTLKNKTQLYKTEHVMTCWNKSPKEARITVPEYGSLMIWNKKGSSSGHVGIVIQESFIPGDDETKTIEGNTGPGKGVQREGDGVYQKFRGLGGWGTMEVKGWLKPWLEV